VPGRELHQRIVQLLMAVPGVQQVEETQAHRFGPYLVVNVTIGIDGSLSVVEGDQIATQVECALRREIELLRRVHVHYHPVQERIER
jgi:divalent metal cation (Fe/Co/Zn/Cd) transporter